MPLKFHGRSLRRSACSERRPRTVGGAVDVPRLRFHGRRRVRVVVRDLPRRDHHVVRTGRHARPSETAADALVGNLERLPVLYAGAVSRVPFSAKCSAHARRRPGSRCALARARWCCSTAGSPLKAERPLSAVFAGDLHAVAGGLDVADVDEAGDAVDHSRAIGPPPVCEGEGSPCRRTTAATSPSVLSSRSRFCGADWCAGSHGCRRSTGLPSGSWVTKTSCPQSCSTSCRAGCGCRG